MKLTERLNVEHGIFLRQLEHLRSMSKQGAPRPVLQAVAGNISVALAAHDRLEDEVLYPLLSRALGVAYPPLAAAQEQHRHIASALAEIVGGTFEDAELEAFIELLGRHIENEIHLVFPLVEAWVEPDELAAAGNWYVEHVLERGRPVTEPSLGS
jgi:hemerythrin-like domain-containing protein